MKKIEQQIKGFYNSKSLSDEQLELIKSQTHKKNNRLISIRKIMKYAAVILFFIITTFIYVQNKNNQNFILQEFANEIAFNHQKQLPSEIKTNNILELKNKMSKLNFDLYLPQKITSNLQLKGGRYCSVDNRIAAQLKFENKQGEIVTCYIFKKEEKFDINQKIEKNKNIEVDIWDDGTLIFALAYNKCRVGKGESHP